MDNLSWHFRSKYEAVIDAIKTRNMTRIDQLEEDITTTVDDKINQAESTLQEGLNNVQRDHLAEGLIPAQFYQRYGLEQQYSVSPDQNGEQFVIARRSTGDGNCLYNSCSLALTGNESLTHYLRFLTSIELVKNTSYYMNHPMIEGASKSLTDIFDSKENMINICLSDDACDAYQIKSNNWDECLRIEAEINCRPGVWSSLMCTMALSSVVGVPIVSVYPSNGEIKYVKLFNCEIEPRILNMGRKRICILWSRSGTLDNTPGLPCRPNHFVPLFFARESISNDTRRETMQTEMQNAKTQTNIIHSNTAANIQSDDKSNNRSTKMQIPSTARQSNTIVNMMKRQHNNTANTEDHPSPKRVSTVNQHNQNETITSETSVSKNSSSSGNQKERGMPVIKKCDANISDFGLFYDKVSSLTDAEKYNLIVNVWKPDLNFDFPVSIERSLRKRFVRQWFIRFTWLVYSKYLDGAFCLPCVLFGRQTGHNTSKLVRLFKSPLTYWTSACSKYEDHELKSLMHRDSMLSLQQFKLVMEKQCLSVTQLADSALRARIKKNREILVPIVDSIIYCGRQNIALRGHRDDSKHEDSDCNPGNFKELIKFGIRRGDHILSEHCKTAPRNATYLSKTIQNEIIACCYEYITDIISKEIKDAGFFAILADETQDSSNQEQMVLVLRFVDQLCQIREEFVNFIHCNAGTSGFAISNQILEHVRLIGLDIGQCRGQGYDGAGNMSGKHIGTAKRIRDVNPKAIYVHCASHRLNLVVANACQIQKVRNMMGTVRIVSDFFNNSPKRQALLEKQIRELFPAEKHRTLIDVCRTRWVLRINGLIRFEEMYKPIMTSLEIIKENTDNSWNRESCRDASNLYAGCCMFDFLIALVTVRNCLAYVQAATVKLQQKQNFDILKGYREIDHIKKELQTVRAALDIKHKVWFSEATKLGEIVGSEPKVPRTCEHQSLRANPQVETAEDYYRSIVAAPFLDHLITDLSSRFSEESSVIVKGFNIVPSLMFDKANENRWRDEFLEFVQAYENDMPLIKCLNAELDLWLSYWQSIEKDERPDRIANTLTQTDPITYPNIFTALKILGTVPVTTCECERSVSTLRRLKTYLRSSMSQERLNGLALIHLHRNIDIDIQAVIDIFARKHPRRLAMIDIMNEVQE